MAAIDSDEYLRSPLFTPRERAAVLWAEHVAKNSAREHDDVFAELKRHFTDAEIVELTGVSGFFVQMNRFQDTLHVPIDESGVVDKIKRGVRFDHSRIKTNVGMMLESWPAEYPDPQVDSYLKPSATPNPVAHLSSAPHGPGCRVRLEDPKHARGSTASFYMAVEHLLGAVPNFVRMWADTPYLGMLCVPFHFALEHEGAGCLLSSTLKAIVLIRTSHLNSAPYSLAHYITFGRAAGLTADQIEAIQSEEPLRSCLFAPVERAAMLWADHVARNTARRNDHLFNEVKPHFNDAQLVELTLTCAATNMVNRVYNALRIPIEPAPDFAVLHDSIRLEPAQLKVYFETILENWPETFPLPVEVA